MTEQGKKRSTASQRLTSSRHKVKQSLEQENQPTIFPHRPTTNDCQVWRAFWQTQNQPWRTEIEIDAERQAYLAEWRTIIPNRRLGVYPFKDIKLNRADVEWLLATHENGRGPVDWTDKSQREREGLDLRGADLRHENLSNLPLARMRGGLTFAEWYYPNSEPPVVIQLEDTNLDGIHLEGAILRGVCLEDAELNGVCLQKANLSDAHMERAKFNGVHLENAELYRAHLEKVNLSETHLEGTILAGANLEDANLYQALLQDANLDEACLENTNLCKAHLEGAILTKANLKKANLTRAFLESANLAGANLEKADLFETHLERAFLVGASLRDTFLKRAYLEGANLKDVILTNEKQIGPKIADIWWSNVSLTAVKWSQVKILGDEYEARQKMRGGKVKDKLSRLEDYENAVRANRQLAIALQSQGLYEDAAHFAYRAQVLHRKVLRRQGFLPHINLWERVRKLNSYVFSGFLDLLAGYGYHPAKTVFWYLFVILVFAIGYATFGHLVLLPDALVFSFMSFHGRGFFPSLSGETSLHNPIVILAAAEAVMGLLVEISFIATFTQRYFEK